MYVVGETHLVLKSTRLKRRNLDKAKLVVVSTFHARSSHPSVSPLNLERNLQGNVVHSDPQLYIEQIGRFEV
jgi:hypothetical protein